MRIWIIRVLFAIIFSLCTFFLQPFELTPMLALLVGFLLSVIIITFEMAIRTSTLKSLIGAGLGSISGIVGAVLISLIIDNMAFLSPNTSTFIQLFTLFMMTYIGMLVGVTKGDSLNLDMFGLVDRSSRKTAKILDTSVIIDGRVAASYWSPNSCCASCRW